MLAIFKTTNSEKGSLSKLISFLFTPPKTKYDDFFENVRFNISWSLISLFSVVLSCLSVAFLFVRTDLLITTVFALVVMVVLQFSLFFTRKYKFSAYGLSYLGSFLCIFSLFYFSSEFHYVDILWSLVLLLFAFYTLPAFHPIFLFTIQIAAYVGYIFFHLRGSLTRINSLSDDTILSLGINFAVASFMIGFIVYRYVKVFKKAQIKAKESNLALINQNELISSQHQEKIVMLKEIHHRVKNNLQVITSLLRLQSKEVKDEKSLECFNDSINRVIAMAMIHEKMYQHKTLHNIDINQYLNQLIDDLIESYLMETKIVKNISSNIQSIDQQKLVSFALIVNELVTNSLKHAFKNALKGSIELSLIQKDGQIHFQYKDDGEWVVNETKTKSFGLEMIDILTEQVDGVKTIVTTPNTEFNFQFPV